MSRYGVQTVLLLFLTAIALTPAGAQSSTDFYRGKTIRMVASAAGGGRALYTLPFAEAFSRHIPGNPTIVPMFIPGAGGSTALNYIAHVAAPDGLTIISPLKAVVMSQVLGDPSVKYDAGKLGWIGRITDATQILMVSSKVAARTLTDFRSEPIVIASAAKSSVTYQNPALINKVLGTKFKIITGYGSVNDMCMSVDRGETQGAFPSWNDVLTYHSEWVRENRIRVMAQIALTRLPDLADVPLLSEFGESDADRELFELNSSSSEMGESFAAPPGVPAAVLATLRTAFDETMRDPAYIERLRAAKIQFNPLTGAQLDNEVARMIATPASVVERYKAAVSGD